MAYTKKRVSETTIKRIYGFAIAKFKPSPFTLQALTEYCGYKSWDEFCNQQENDTVNHKSPENNSWGTLCSRTAKITKFTLQALKTRSGIPFELTIKRKFIQEHFDAFLQSGKPITLFTAQAGYGKTIGLCHLVDDLLKEKLGDNCSQDMVLFLGTQTITTISPHELNLGNWFLSLLGLQSNTNLIEVFEQENTLAGNFYLIIDGFDEYMFKQEQFFLFFNQLIDIISYYSKYSWFKVILTMRSSTWLNYRYLVEEKQHLWDKWFTGFMNDASKSTNFIPFETGEILDLTHKINPNIASNCLPSLELINKLSYPLFFQLYYQKNAQNFTIAETNHLTFYQIIASFVSNKVYRGANSMEKVLLLQTLVEMIDYQNNNFTVPKWKFSAYIKKYPGAYKELLINDVLKEENFSEYFQYKEQISLGNHTLLEYGISRKLYRLNDEKLDRKLLDEIEKTLGKSTIKVPVLKWMVFFIISSNTYEQLNYLKEVTLYPLEKLEVIIFTCQLLQKQLSETEDKEELKKYFQKIDQDETFSFFLSLQYITPEYEKALQTLLNFDLSNKNKILIYTTLSAISILNLNADKAEKYIKEINNFVYSDLEKFIVNPLNCLNTIFCYFKYGIVQKEALQSITHLCYDDYKLRKMRSAEYNSNEIIFKLALLTLKINNNIAKEVRFIDTVLKYFKPDDNKENSPLHIFFLGLNANNYLKKGNTKKALKIQNQLLKIQHADTSVYTPFMKIFFSFLTIRNSSHDKAGEVALMQTKSLIAYCNKMGFKVASVFTAIVYLNSLQAAKASKEDNLEIYNSTLKQIRVSGFRMESFFKSNIQSKIERLTTTAKM
ncbi:MAG: hypothetical protein EOP42_07330 [Sphingobacteriaceae bacterium]|nr:MAG: hypothetical protein EOP42_07330 [Sphingobacteriaceae bacterium]